MSYKQILLKQDGTTQDLGTSPKKRTLEELYKILGCNIVEIIPSSYYEGHGRCTMWGDEEGRFNKKNHRNPHFKVLIDDQKREWDVVGNILKEEKVK